jgi:NADPH2:quinone reductase
VIAVAGGPEKGRACRELGADLVLDHRDGGLAAAVRDATGGAGANVIYDPVGGEMFDTATRCIASEGRLLAIGFASGAWHDASTARLVDRNASVVGVYVGAYQKPFLSEVHERLLEHWRRGEIRSNVSDAIPFVGIGDALGELANRRATGKLVASVQEIPVENAEQEKRN